MVNQYASVPVEHSVHLKECYKNIDFVLNKLGYSDHKWINCRNLQVISMLLGQQSRCTMFPLRMGYLCQADVADQKGYYSWS